MEYLIHVKHSLKILYKSKHFPGRYKRKGEWMFFSENSVHNRQKTQLKSKLPDLLYLQRMKSYMHQQKSDNEAAALTVTNVFVSQRVRLHTVQEQHC